MAPAKGWALWRGKEVPRLHLFYTGALQTVCGRGTREAAVGRGSTSWCVVAGGPAICAGAIHVSRARRIDCPECRWLVRADLWAREVARYNRARQMRPGCGWEQRAKLAEAMAAKLRARAYRSRYGLREVVAQDTTGVRVVMEQMDEFGPRWLVEEQCENGEWTRRGYPKRDVRAQAIDDMTGRAAWFRSIRPSIGRASSEDATSMLASTK
jgi:hypothetical protein